MHKEDHIIKTIASPCINTCELNQANICTGCYRSIDEIMDWRELSNDVKEVIIERAKKRKIESE